MPPQAASDDVWTSCGQFLHHLCWHKSRPAILGPKIESIPDSYLGKPKRPSSLVDLVHALENIQEAKRFRILGLELLKNEDDFGVSYALLDLAKATSMLGEIKGGIAQAKEASVVFTSLKDLYWQRRCYLYLTSLLLDDDQLQEARGMWRRGVQLLPGEVSQAAQKLSNISSFPQQVVYIGQEACRVCSVNCLWLDDHDGTFWAEHAIAVVEGSPDLARGHSGCAKDHATILCNRYLVGIV